MTSTRSAIQQYTASALLIVALAVQLFHLPRFFVSADGLHDAARMPLYGDFAPFWLAARNALIRVIEYDQGAFHRLVASVFGRPSPAYSFLYPPTYVLLIAPLGLLPFQLAGALWMAGGLATYLVGMRRLFGASIGFLPLIAFGGVYQTVICGQNGLYATGLFALAIANAATRPILAGACATLLATKPQIAVTLPFLFILQGRWRAMAAAIAFTMILTLTSLAIFGPEAWMRFLALGNETMRINIGGYRQSVYNIVANLRGLHSDGLMLQALAVAFVAFCFLAVRRHALSAQALAALGAAATPLISPFFLDYDFVILAPAIAWLCFSRAKRPDTIDMIVIASAFIAPPFLRHFAYATHITLGPLIALTVLLRVTRRISSDAAA
ncbi:MAG TPA: glycosyltransferase family 87 protein [Beijerinckiaceae bacterium]|nr:DUF2029 domain-containing protein [Rhodoblastus sp.]MCC2107919.1 DUF2029 domain-containing protein [Hyphomicrobiales bacterium]HPG04570.1 glycosyltransferase family 87 protein [Rhodoblastus sp.]HRY01608.1 glycosyltransferase family 87 protein [Beijerinckiaceae bacterium]